MFFSLNNKNQYTIITYVFLLVIGGLSIISYLLVSREYRDFAEKASELSQRSQIISRKELIRQKDYAMDYIIYMKSQTRNFLKNNIKVHVDEAYHFIDALVQSHKSGQEKHIKELIAKIFPKITFNENRGYYFIIDMDGVAIVHGGHMNLQGKNLIARKETREIVSGMVDLMNKQDEGFYEYDWYAPDDSKKAPTKKIVYLKKIPELNLFLGTGEYVENVEKVLKQDVLERLSSIKFDVNGKIEVIEMPLGDIFPDHKEHSLQEKFVLLENDKKFNHYSYEYYFNYPDWNWTLKVSSSLLMFDPVLNKEKRQMKERLMANLTLIAIIIFGLTFLVSIPLFHFIRSFNNVSALSSELENIIDFSGDAFLTVNQQGKILRSNHICENIFPHFSSAKNFFSYLNEKDTQLVQEDFANIKAEAKNITRHFRIQGNDLPVAISISPIHPLQKEKGFSLIVRDMTAVYQNEQELIEAKRKAEKANNAKTAFLNNIGHEIKTPVNSIQGLSEILQKEENIHTLKGYFKVINRNSIRLTSVIEKILDFTRLEKGDFAKAQRPFHLKKVIDDVITNNRQLFQEKEIVLNIFYKGLDDDYFIGDEFTVRQILHNLIENSYKFTMAGSIDLKVIGQKKDAYHALLDITIQDTGIGIKQSELDNIIRPFEQEDLSYKRKFGGAGLGLTLVNELVKQMDGSLNIQKSAKGGTLVALSVILPYVHQTNFAKQDSENQIQRS